MSKYIDLLEKEYNENNETDCLKSDDKLEFLSRFIFDFTTYDSGKDRELASRMIDVIDAISKKQTFEYHRQNEENYLNYILMCNMPFLKDKLEWGTSIRGAWFSGNRFEISGTNIIVPSDEVDHFFYELVKWVKHAN